MVSILIVEDHTMVRAALRRHLESLGYDVVGEAGSAPAALELARSLEPDLLLLDLTMPGDAFETIACLRASQPRPRILVLTGLEDDATALRCLRAGVDGFLHKSEPPERLEQALEQLAGGHRFVSDRLTGLLVTALQAEEQPHRLSKRETQVARSIAAGQTVTEIASDLGLSIKTISTYRARLLEKLGLSNNAELIRYWLQVEPKDDEPM